MRRSLFFACLIALGPGLALGVVAIGAPACSSPENSTFDPQFPASDTGTPFDPLGGDGSTETGTTFTCTPKIPDPFTAKFIPPVKKPNACSSDDLTGYATACGDVKAADAKQKCATWVADHATCAACLEPTDGSGPFQWDAKRKGYTLNIGACVALVQNNSGQDSCGFAFATSVQCQREACEYCLTDYDVNPAVCKNEAKKLGTCKSRETLVAAQCSGLTAVDASTLPCLPTSSGESIVSYGPRIAAFFCGP